MKAHGVTAYLVPHADAHGSEYLCSRDERLAFISGFDGSAGTAVVTLDAALLWTDGRYFNQATHQLSTEWRLMKSGLPETEKIHEFLSRTGENLGFDPLLVSFFWEKEMSEKLKGKLKPIDENLVDLVWQTEGGVPKEPSGRVWNHEAFAGESVQSKLDKLRTEMTRESVDYFVISALDEVAWLLNMRGEDIPYNPVFFGYAIVGHKQAWLFGGDQCKAALDSAIELQPYGSFLEFLKTINSCSIWFDADSTSSAVGALSKKRVEKTSPIAIWKSAKNEVEVQGARAAHVRDGLAETKWLFWLEQAMHDPVHHDEVSLANKLEEFRSAGKYFRGLSFPSISSFGANAAVIHYHATDANKAQADNSKIYLIDSGAQYDDGTTDVTRTCHFGDPEDEIRDAYTRVLQGVIAVASAVFPEGTTGPALDALGRQYLWRAGLDFRHGIGHGVGSCLCVHEGPQSIGQARLFDGGKGVALKTPLKRGMLLSDEPGFYKDGSFGIRIENVMVVTESNVTDFFTGKKMLTFETLTKIPIQKKMIKTELLSADQVEWIDSYHEEVYHLHAPHLNQQEQEWLKQQCSPL